MVISDDDDGVDRSRSRRGWVDYTEDDREQGIPAGHHWSLEFICGVFGVHRDLQQGPY